MGKSTEPLDAYRCVCWRYFSYILMKSFRLFIINLFYNCPWTTMVSEDSITFFCFLNVSRPMVSWPSRGPVILFCLFVGVLLLGNIKVLNRQVPTCNSLHSGWLYIAAPLGDQAAITVTRFPTQSNYPDTELARPCHILVMPNTRLGSDKYQLCKSMVCLNHDSISWPSAGETYALPIRSPRPSPVINATVKWKKSSWCTDRL